MIEGFEFTNQGDAIHTADPTAEAITFVREEGTERVSVADLVDRADALADRLLGLGLPAGASVAILGANSADWVVAFYGVLRAGLVAVPLSYKFPPAVLRYALDNTEARVVLVDFPERLVDVDTDARVLTLAEATTRGTVARSPRHERDGSDAAMILFTSGSTGMPKGVVLSQDSHLWVLAQGRGTAADGAATLVAAPLYHMNALATVQAALLAGRRVVLLETFDARRFLTVIPEESVARVTGVPPMYALALAETDLVEGLELGGVREVVLGSSPASEALFEAIGRAFPNATTSFTYGTTESGPVAFAPHPGGLPTPVGSVGVAHPEVSVRLVDAAGQDAGDDGVLEIRTGALMSGYHNRPDVASPLTADGYYHTRDRFVRDADGFFSFAGRSDDMFTSGGENVYPQAVAEVLEQHPEVSEAAVVPVADEVKGARPVAFVVLRPGGRADEAELRRWSLTRLEPYAHPRRVVVVPSLPLSSTNKVDRNLLAAEAAQLLGGRR